MTSESTSHETRSENLSTKFHWIITKFSLSNEFTCNFNRVDISFQRVQRSHISQVRLCRALGSPEINPRLAIKTCRGLAPLLRDLTRYSPKLRPDTIVPGGEADCLRHIARFCGLGLSLHAKRGGHASKRRAEKDDHFSRDRLFRLW